MEWIKSIITLFNKKQRFTVVILILLGIGTAFLDTLSSYIILPFIYAVIDQGSINNGSMRTLYDVMGCSSNDEFVIRLALVIAGLYFFVAVYKIFQAFLTAQFRNSTRHFLARQVFSKTIYSSYEEITHINSAEIQRLISSDINRVNAIVVQLINIITALLTSFSLIGVLWFLDKRITIFAGTVIILVIFLINRPITSRVKKIGNVITETNTKMVKIIQQFFGGYKTIIACGRQGSIDRKFLKESYKNSNAYLKASTLEAIPMHLSQGLIMSAIFIYMAVVALYGGSLTAMLPTLATFALAAMKLIPLVGRVSSSFVAVKVDIPAINSVKSFMDSNVGYDVNRTDNLVEERVALNKEIVLQNVSFAFNNAEAELFKNVSICIPANTSVAFIGPTGAGKTTLADIIIGLYKPQKGKVLADGKDIYNNRKWWASQIGYITQRIYLIDDTIRANVAYECDDDPDDEKIWKCLKDACIDDYVRSLPDGLDTICGENGVRFSGGQQQRLGIARALYTNPSVLVFDEATSALDVDTESEIVQSIQNLSGKKTLIIIAHRLSTIESCELKYRIDEKGVRIVN